MSNRIFSKLEKVNSKKEEVTFKMEYNGNKLHEISVEIPSYAKKILEENETNFYYFFKEVSNKFEELLSEMHKKKMWEQIDKENGRGKAE